MMLNVTVKPVAVALHSTISPFTITPPLTVTSPHPSTIPGQLLSFIPVKQKVFNPSVEGETVKVYGLVFIPDTVVGVPAPFS